MAKALRVKSTTCKTVEQIVEREIKKMTKLLRDGLPRCYQYKVYAVSGKEKKVSKAEGFKQYLADYGADFSWNAYCSVEYQALLDNEKWCKLAAQIKRKHKFDFVKVLKEEVSSF